MTDHRYTADTINDDALDQLYERLAKAERAADLLAGSHRRAEQALAGRATWKAKAEEIERDRDRLAAALDRLRDLMSRYERRVVVDLFEVRAALDGAEQPKESTTP